MADRFQRIWSIVERIDQMPGLGRRQLSEEFALSERQLQADLEVIRVEMGLPLGPSIVHEVRTADGRAIKVTEPRAAGAQPRAPGSAVRVQTVGSNVISIFPAAAA